MFRTLFLSSLIALSSLGLSAPALAAELKTVKFEVDNMTCSMCPYTVKKALRKVNGVTKVKAQYEGGGKGWAEVTFDPATTDVQQLIQASTEAGYPAHQ